MSRCLFNGDKFEFRSSQLVLRAPREKVRRLLV
jgi:hypothetical protein